jgi:hypothetical protein
VRLKARRQTARRIRGSVTVPFLSRSHPAGSSSKQVRSTVAGTPSDPEDTRHHELDARSRSRGPLTRFEATCDSALLVA